MLRGFTRAIRRICMASEFTRGIEDPRLTTNWRYKSTADVNGNLNRIADKIDPEGELKEFMSGIKSNGDIDDAIEELSSKKHWRRCGSANGIRNNTAKTPTKTPKAKSAKKKKS